MRIIVCLKQVPDSTEVKINPETGTLIRAGVPSILNPFDHFALEKALETVRRHGGEVIALSMGPAQAKTVLQMAVALGARSGILLCDAAFAGSDTWASSYALSRAAAKIGKFDLILCGQQAIDGDTAQTGPGIAQHLAIPQITYCEKFEVAARKIEAHRLIDGGYHEIVECRLPCLCTMSAPHSYKGARPSFAGIAAAAKKTVEIWTAEDIGADKTKIGLNGSPTRVDRIFPPPARERGTICEGSAAELAKKAVSVLCAENIIRTKI